MQVLVMRYPNSRHRKWVMIPFQRRDNGVFATSGLRVRGSSFRGTAYSTMEVEESEPSIIGDTIRRTFVYQWPLPLSHVLLILSSLLPSPVNTIFYT